MNYSLKKLVLVPLNILYSVAPITEQKLMFFLKFGYPFPKNPKTFNEKLNWIKMYYRNDLMPKCADKYWAREYIKSKGVGEYLPKLYWHGFDADMIPYENLPNKFVIKVTHGCGFNIICIDKSNLDRSEVRNKLKVWLKEKYLKAYGEWHYGKYDPRIIIEEFIDNGTGTAPDDYKLFCFNNLPNKVGFTAIDSNRFVHHKRTLYDADWQVRKDWGFGFDVEEDIVVPKPLCYNEMVKVAQLLSSPFPHSRIDFYVLGDRFYIGEITFFNGAGYDRLSPIELNKEVGSWISI